MLTATMKSCWIGGWFVYWVCLLDGCHAVLRLSTFNHDICMDDMVGVLNAGANGTIGIGELSINKDTPNPCVLQLRACSTCQIRIHLNDNNNFKFFCPTNTISPTRCNLGCDYLYMFDMYYMNDTLKVFKQFEQFQFVSQSSQLFIVVCHGFSQEYKISMTYTVIKKHTFIQGNSAVFDTMGEIHSPFFPVGYAQNHETYEYQFTSTSSMDNIYLQFDDWHLADSSTLYFEGCIDPGPVYGDSSRPIVVSSGNKMRVIFHTGQAIGAGQKREYIGFKATYHFISNRQLVSSPATNCLGAGYLLKSMGGEITIKHLNQAKVFVDCIWVVKTQDGFSGVSLKLIKMKLRAFGMNHGMNELQVRSGLTSDSKLLATLRADADSHSAKYDSRQGFYIRINSSLSSGDEIVLSYASYKDPYQASGCTWQGLFTCSRNGRCIDKALVCDGYDHCGDNSDEMQGCQVSVDDWDQSSQHSLTVSVIVPIVISVFLIMVICLLFVMVRRCRAIRRREAGMAEERLQSLSEEVSSENRAGRQRRRRSRPRWFPGNHAERDMPPSYNEAIQNPPGWYLNVAFGNPADPSLPQPPSYSEAVSTPDDPSDSSHPARPSSTDSSSQSEVTIHSRNPSISSSSSGDSAWTSIQTEVSGRTGRCGRHDSSSESEDEQLHDVPEPSGDSSDIDTMATSSGAHEDGANEAPSPKPTEGDKDVEKQSNVSNEHITGDGVIKKLCSDDETFVIPDGPKVGAEQSHNPSGNSHSSNTHQDRPIAAGFAPVSMDQAPTSATMDRAPRSGTMAPTMGTVDRAPAMYERSPSLVSGTSTTERLTARPRPRSRKSHPKKQRRASSKRLKDSAADSTVSPADPRHCTSNVSDCDMGGPQLTGMEGDQASRPGDSVMVMYDTAMPDDPHPRREPSSSPGLPQYLLAGPVTMHSPDRSDGTSDRQLTGHVCEDPLHSNVDLEQGHEPVDRDSYYNEPPVGRLAYRGSSPPTRVAVTDENTSYGHGRHGVTEVDSPQSSIQDLSITSGYHGDDLYLDTSVTSGPVDASPTGTVDGRGDMSIVSGEDRGTGQSGDTGPGTEYLNLYRLGEENEDVYV